MIPTFFRPLLAAGLILGLAAGAQAQSFDNQVGARQGQFKLNGAAIGTLAGMARGRIDYDAEMAQMAAAMLVATSQIPQTAILWPEGSDNIAIDGTRALPAIWDDFADFQSKWADFGAAAVALQAVAGNGQEALGGALGALGGSCQACHDSYQAPSN